MWEQQKLSQSRLQLLNFIFYYIIFTLNSIVIFYVWNKKIFLETMRDLQHDKSIGTM